MPSQQGRAVADLPGITEYPVGDGDWDTNRVFPITTIVIHTEVGFKLGTEVTFGNPQSHVSAHYGVNEDGSYDHFVDETNVAYHAGVYAMNQHSIGIEHEDFARPNDPRPDAQYIASAKLVHNIAKFWGIPIDRKHIIKHNEVPYPTGCPDSLDVDRIVAMAAALDNVPTPTPPVVQDFGKNSLDFLISVFPTLTDFDNQPFGNIEGMTRALVGAYPKYKALIQPDATGHPPVVLSFQQFLDLNAKVKSTDTPPVSTPVETPTDSVPDNLPIFADNSSQGSKLPGKKNAAISLLRKPLEALIKAYAALFLSPNP